jgi:hypothetical protein
MSQSLDPTSSDEQRILAGYVDTDEELEPWPSLEPEPEQPPYKVLLDDMPEEVKTIIQKFMDVPGDCQNFKRYCQAFPLQCASKEFKERFQTEIDRCTPKTQGWTIIHNCIPENLLLGVGYDRGSIASRDQHCKTIPVVVVRKLGAWLPSWSDWNSSRWAPGVPYNDHPNDYREYGARRPPQHMIKKCSDFPLQWSSASLCVGSGTEVDTGQRNMVKKQLNDPTLFYVFSERGALWGHDNSFIVCDSAVWNLNILRNLINLGPDDGNRRVVNILGGSGWVDHQDLGRSRSLMNRVVSRTAPSLEGWHHWAAQAALPALRRQQLLQMVQVVTEEIHNMNHHFTPDVVSSWITGHLASRYYGTKAVNPSPQWSMLYPTAPTNVEWNWEHGKPSLPINYSVKIPPGVPLYMLKQKEQEGFEVDYDEIDQPMVRGGGLKKKKFISKQKHKKATKKKKKSKKKKKKATKKKSKKNKKGAIPITRNITKVIQFRDKLQRDKQRLLHHEYRHLLTNYDLEIMDDMGSLLDNDVTIDDQGELNFREDQLNEISYKLDNYLAEE